MVLSWFHSLSAAILGRYLMTLASRISGAVQCNPTFTFEFHKMVFLVLQEGTPLLHASKDRTTWVTFPGPVACLG